MIERFPIVLPALFALAALLLPIAVLSISAGVTHLVAPQVFFRIPALAALPKLGGFVLGIGALYHRDEAWVYDPTLLFEDGSFWNMSALQFLAARADPVGYRLGELSIGAFIGLPDPLLDTMTLGSATLVVIAGAVALTTIRGMELARVLLAIPVVVFSTAFLTVYLVSLFLWSANALNFWVFLLAAAIYQKRRYASHH
ncbi:hypothetical protein N825_33195 [Skermanella stibiiresistens SB22]|uniref:Uncharacterized protein n=1 Tax=Skermanella stibiiresistens SB22 TaxID=1385369 RepID=W9H7X1_9PROT|nr:hypothetical protein [Skermanella stibiiresistens]EWY40787.1 hypothetical protein N825_33195 [Skermanella stibiiresistens SB22]